MKRPGTRTKLIILAAAVAAIFAQTGPAEAFARRIGQYVMGGTDPADRGSGSVPLARVEPMVSIDFDDGWKSAYEKAVPVLEEAGFKATFYISTDERWPDAYMSIDQIRDLERRGHTIANHTRTHKRLTEATDEELVEETAGARRVLESWGIDPAPGFAYPYNAYDQRVIEAVKASGAEYARIAAQGFNTRITDPYLLRSHTPDNDTSFEEFKKNIDTAVRTGSWYIISFHRIGEEGKDRYTTPLETFRQVVDYLKESGVRVVTVDEGVRLLGK